MSELSIKVTIAGRIYPLTVRAEEEGNVREAAKRVDDNIKLLQNSYAVKDKQDLLAMTALQISSKVLEQEKINQNSTSDADLNKIEQKIDELGKL